jgi:ribosomal protein S6--L-glutamate ligase
MLFGWQEWVGLPDLGLPAIRAKIDTGARTSALHADAIVEQPGGWVTFDVHPISRRLIPIVACRARLVDRREVTSSNGEREKRLVIATRLAVGDQTWPIEITLTDRGGMRTRMLLGRQGMPPGALVDPDRILLQPRLSYRVYRKRRV